MGKKRTKCLNCGYTVSDNFCAHCGQSNATGRITLKDIFKNLLAASFSFESTFFTSVKSLVVNPGKLYREYLAGRRNSYINPIAYFVLVTLAYVLLRSVVVTNPLENIDTESSLLLSNNLKPYLDRSIAFVINNINNILIIQVIVLALFVKVFHKSSYNYAELLMVCFYISGTYNLLGTVIMIFDSYAHVQMGLWKLFILDAIIIYHLASFFNRYTFGFFVKMFLISVLSLFTYAFSVIFFFTFIFKLFT